MSSVESLLSRLAQSWLSDPSGRALLATWATTFGVVTARAVFYRRKQRKALQQAKAAEAKAAKPAAAAPAEAAKKSPIRALVKLAIPARTSRPMLWGAALSVGIAFRLVVQIKVSREIGVLGSLLAQKKWDALFQRQLGYALYGLPAALLAAFQKYAGSNLALSLRTNIMKRLHAGLGSTSSLPRVYTCAAGAAPATSASAATKAANTPSTPVEDSAVQLATADVAAFCTEVVTLYEGLFKPLVEVLLSSTMLGSMMGGGPLLYCYTYFAIAGWWARFVSPSFATMTEKVCTPCRAAPPFPPPLRSHRRSLPAAPVPPSHSHRALRTRPFPPPPIPFHHRRHAPPPSSPIPSPRLAALAIVPIHRCSRRRGRSSTATAVFTPTRRR